MESGIAVPTLREQVIKQGVEDSWWLAVDGQPLDKPLRLRAIEMMLRDDPNRDYHILNSKQAEAGDTEWRCVYLMPKLRTPSQASAEVQDGGINTAQITEIAELKARVNLLETNQAKLQETVAELKMMLRQMARQRRPMDDLEEEEEEDEVPERKLYPHEQRQQLSKAEQLRAKVRNRPAIRLVG